MPPGFVEQNIYNRTGDVVNDLHLAFVGGTVTNVKSQTKTATNSGGGEWDFKTGNFFTIQNGDFAPIKFDDGGTHALIATASSYWTLNGKRPIVSNLSVMGEAPRIDLAFNTSTGQWVATAVFTNPESFDISYKDITVYLANPLANYNIDQFDSPLGTAKSIDQVNLKANGGTASVLLGDVSPSAYVFLASDAVASGTSSPLFHFGVASAVPEPSGLLLCSVGFLALAIGDGARRRIAVLARLTDRGRTGRETKS